MNNRSNMIKMGNHIADLRKKKGYTQKTLGDILDVSDKTVCKWEKGIVAPDITILSSLANTLDVTVEEILSGEEVKKIDAIETIDIYSNMTKRKLIKIFVIFILIFLLSAFFVFRIEEYYSWHLTPLYSEREVIITGYLLSNNKESKIAINKLFFAESIPNDIIKIDISLKYDNKLLYYKSIEVDKTKEINDYINNYNICIDSKNAIDSNKLKMVVLLFNSNDDITTYTIDF